MLLAENHGFLPIPKTINYRGVTANNHNSAIRYITTKNKIQSKKQLISDKIQSMLYSVRGFGAFFRYKKIS